MKLTINKKLIFGFVVVSLFIGAAGGLGLLNVLKIRKATEIISREEIPISNAVSKMYSLLLTNKNLIEMYKGATTSIPLYNEEILPALEEDFQDNVNLINIYANAILNGATVDSQAILATSNSALRETMNEGILRYMSGFVTAAKDTMEMGKEMLSQKDMATYIMNRMEYIYEYIYILLTDLDNQFKTDELFNEHPKEVREMITILMKARLNLEDIAHYWTLDIIEDIEENFINNLTKFDSLLSKLINDLNLNISKKEDAEVENSLLKSLLSKLSQQFIEFKQVSKGLISTQKKLIKTKKKSDIAIERLDKAKEKMLTILSKAAGEAEKGVVTAKTIIDKTEITSKFVLILTASIGSFLGIIFGVFYSRQITKKLQQLVKATQVIASGNLEHKVDVTSKDEIGILALSFNKMVVDLEKTTVSKHKLEEIVKERTKELEATYNCLIQAEKLSATGKLSASIAHEFNNPIYGILNVLERVSERVIDGKLDETHKELVDLAIRECNRVAKLIQSLQDFHRPSSGIPVPCNIHDAIDDMVRMTKKKLKEKKIRLKRHYADDIPTINAVPDQIKQVLLNLIQNAEGAMDENGGRISITTERSGPEVKIYVQDTGRGIPPETMKSIFEPFFTTKSVIKGTGLGLSVSYGIVQKHGGNITVQSEPGKGATFTITLPINSVMQQEKISNQLT